MSEIITFKISEFNNYVFSFEKSRKLNNNDVIQQKSKRQEYNAEGYKPLMLFDLEKNKKLDILQFDEKYNFVNISQRIDVVNGIVNTITPPQKYDKVIKYLLDKYKKYKNSNHIFSELLEVTNKKYTGFIYLHEFAEFVVIDDRRSKILKIKNRIMKNTQL